MFLVLMRCEILSLARRLRNDPNLECGETCKINQECSLIEDDSIFPKMLIKEDAHNENIIDGMGMDLPEIVRYLRVGGNGMRLKDIIYQIEEEERKR